MTAPNMSIGRTSRLSLRSVAQPYGTGAASIRRPMRYGSRRQLRLLPQAGPEEAPSPVAEAEAQVIELKAALAERTSDLQRPRPST